MPRVCRWISPVLLLLLLTLPLAAQQSRNIQDWRAVARLGSGAIHDAVWLPDGERFAIASDTGVRIYDLALNPVADLYDYEVNRIAWHPNGEILAIYAESTEHIALWGIHDVRLSGTLTPIPRARPPFAWSPDGRWLAYSDARGQVHLWDLIENRRGSVFREHMNVSGEHKPQILDLSWSPDSALIASTGVDTPLYVWSAATGDVIQTVSGAANNLWEGAWLYWSDDATLKVFDFHTTNRPLLHTITPETQTLMPVRLPSEDMVAAFHPRGNTFATVSPYQMVQLYHWQDHEPEPVARQHFSGDSTVTSQERGGIAVWSSDNTHLLTVTLATAVLWQVQNATLKRVGMLTDYNGALNDLAWSPDGAYLATAHGAAEGGSDARLRIWDVAENKLVWRSEWGMSSVLSLAWSPDGTHLATGHFWDECALRLWEVAAHTMVSCVMNAIYADRLAWQPEGDMLASMHDGQLHLWDTTPLTERQEAVFHRLDTNELFYPVGALAWMPDGAALVSNGYPGNENVVVWRVSDGEILTKLQGSNVYTRNPRRTANPYALVIAVSPDAHWIALAEGKIGMGVLENLSLNATIAIYDATTGRRVRQLTGHRSGVTALDWSADSTLLISGSRDGTVRLWSPDQARELATLLEHDEMIVDVAWSPDNMRIAAGTVKGAIYMLGE